MTGEEPIDPMEGAWLDAAAQLGIRSTVPYFLRGDLDRVRFPVYLPDFGGPTGMVIAPLSRDSGSNTQRRAASQAGVYFSQLADDYRSFDRDLFIDTLNDWGWFGSEDATPNWYTGKEWD